MSTFRIDSMISFVLSILSMSLTNQELINQNQIPIHAGVNLSYLNEEEQYLVYSVISEIKGAKIDMKKSALIRSSAKKEELTKDIVVGIIKGKVEKR